MKQTLEEKVEILKRTSKEIEGRNKNGNKYFLEGFKFGIEMSIRIMLEQELD